MTNQAGNKKTQPCTWSFMRTQNDPHYETFRNIRKHVSSMVNKAKDDHFRKLLNRVQYPDIGSRSFYKIINTLYNAGASSTKPLIVDNGVVYSSPLEQATLFNEHFAKKSSMAVIPYFKLPHLQYI